MLTPSPSLVNVILVLLLSLLSILTPVEVLAGVTSKTAATSGLPNATSTAVTSSTPPPVADTASSLVSKMNSATSSVPAPPSSSSSSSTSSSSLSSSPPSTAVPPDNPRLRAGQRTAGQVLDSPLVQDSPLVRMGFSGETTAPGEDGIPEVLTFQDESLHYNGSVVAAVADSDFEEVGPAPPFVGPPDPALRRERRSSNRDRDITSNSSGKNSKRNNNSKKKRKDSDKSPKENRAGTVSWSEEIQVGCRELRARRYITDGFCTSTKPIREVVCAGHCLPIRDMPWYAEFVKTMAKSKIREWQCVEDLVKRKRVQLLCKNGFPRYYRIRVVKSCKCEKVSNSNSTHSRKQNRRRRKKKKKGKKNRTGRGS